MTISIAIRVPDKGCVIMADGQITDQEGAIWSKTHNKVHRFRSAIVGVAGYYGVIKYLEDQDPEGLEEINSAVRGFKGNAEESWEFQLLVYDPKVDKLRAMEHYGQETEHERWAAIGIGAQFAAGVLSVLKNPTSLDQALKQAEQACRVVCGLSCYCGGVLRYLKCDVNGHIYRGALL